MSEFKERIDALASLMEEYRLTEAVLEDGPFRVVFRRHSTPVAPTPSVAEALSFEAHDEAPFETEPAVPAAPVGTPISSPMNGIFYDAQSPTSPPFVKEGDSVTAGQIVGLIEAMKVFNEIPSPVSGVVKKVVAEAGTVVAVGDTLFLVG
ncbi:acetyl-CoA carboxylase biotin carboxyl carrier protein [bacterium]|nr:MAG: acetyl-CoA carboxylase biotin carboxyl carrier protein [bacterium]